MRTPGTRVCSKHPSLRVQSEWHWYGSGLGALGGSLVQSPWRRAHSLVDQVEPSRVLWSVWKDNWYAAQNQFKGVCVAGLRQPAAHLIVIVPLWERLLQPATTALTRLTLPSSPCIRLHWSSHDHTMSPNSRVPITPTAQRTSPLPVHPSQPHLGKALTCMQPNHQRHAQREAGRTLSERLCPRLVTTPPLHISHTGCSA